MGERSHVAQSISAMNAIDKCIRFENCEAHISWNKFSLKLSFCLEVAADGEIQLDFNPVPLNDDTTWILDAHYQKSPTPARLSLNGTSPEACSIRSDSVYLTGVGQSSTPSRATIELKAHASRIRIDLVAGIEDGAAEWALDSYSPGLMCFGRVAINHELGEISAVGITKDEDVGRICGIVRVKKKWSERENIESWVDDVGKKVDRILDILSLASGRFLRCTSRKTYRNGRLIRIETLVHSPAAKAYRPIFQPLDLRPVLELATNNYTDELIDRTGMDVALEWHLMPQSYDESRLLCQMTALEHMVTIFLKHTSSTGGLLPRCFFRKRVRPAIERTLEQVRKKEVRKKISEGNKDNSELEDSMRRLTFKIGNLNERPLRSNIEAMLKNYGVPHSDLFAMIPKVVKARNEIVHRGVARSENLKDSLRDCVSAAEELLTRIFLTLLKYDGVYTTYFRAVEDRAFPGNLGNDDG